MNLCTVSKMMHILNDYGYLIILGIVIIIAICILFKKREKNTLYQLSLLFLGAFFSVLIALQVNVHLEHRKELEAYNKILRNIYMELTSNLREIDRIKKVMSKEEYGFPASRLHNSALKDALYSSVFMKHCKDEDLILLLELEGNIAVINNALDTMVLKHNPSFLLRRDATLVEKILKDIKSEIIIFRDKHYHIAEKINNNLSPKFLKKFEKAGTIVEFRK